MSDTDQFVILSTEARISVMDNTPGHTVVEIQDGDSPIVQVVGEWTTVERLFERAGVAIRNAHYSFEAEQFMKGV